MERPRRPEWDATVRVEEPITVQLASGDAYTCLAAVHEARRLLQRPEHAALLDALALLERELGMAIGAEVARAFLLRRARRRRARTG